MSGYFSMLVGKIEEAKALLTDSRISGRESAIAHSLLGQIYLIQNSKEQASGEAATAMQVNGESPMARMTAALVKISDFDLPEARRLLEEALAADPHFLEAYVYLARLWLGADYLDRAWEVIGKALEISKTDSEALSLAGFIRLGYRDFNKASVLFTESIKYNPGVGEPHIGLANVAFRNRNFSLGLTEMLTATLLEPRISLYQSSLGKALYQTRSFDKALEVYDYAKTLDPNDPTPYLYKGIALSDLYRPGEAIQEINKSIELNDNMAVFRTRLMLDRDLAVRNTDLARAYNQLGLGDWAYSKALTAVQNDPLNASARLFLADAYGSQRIGAANSQFTLYKLLSPANENTLSEYTDYTQMFEMPYARVSASAEVGTWADHQAPVQDHYLDVLGGQPGLALDAYAEYSNDPGFRKINCDQEYFYGAVEGKFEPTIKDSFYASYIYNPNWSGDALNLNDFSYKPDPNLRETYIEDSVEGGYVHRFSPSAVFLGYFNWGNINVNYSTFSSLPSFLLHIRDLVDYDTVQLQQQLKIGDHTFIGGLDYFTGSHRFFQDFQVDSDVPFNSVENYHSPYRATSFYVFDYWRISPQLLAELGFSGDITSSPRDGYPDSISSSTVNPSVGLNYQINTSNTLRLSYQSYVNTHTSVPAPSISPSEVAGFPSQVYADDGSHVKELGFAWESQWNPLTFTVLRLLANRVDSPEFSNVDTLLNVRTEGLGGSFSVNRLLTSALGLSVGVSGSLVSTDDPTQPLTGDFNEIDGIVTLSYIHPSGWFATIRDTVVHQDLSGLSDQSLAQKQADMGNPFNLFDITFGKYFANKRGYAALGITNLFNQHFYYQTDSLAAFSLNPANSFDLQPFYPDREVLAVVTLYF